MKEKLNSYIDPAVNALAVSEGRHRSHIGGLWSELGELQYTFLKAQGLEPQDFLLDIGCGCLRAGLHFIDYMHVAHYYGVDISEDLLRAGYEVELKDAGLTDKLPRDNLAVSEDFDFQCFDQRFDYALAQSVFTHLPACYLKLCVRRLEPWMNPGGQFFFTLFLVAEQNWDQLQDIPNLGIQSGPTRDPFHYDRQDLASVFDEQNWTLEVIGDWKHPRGQQMVCLTRK